MWELTKVGREGCADSAVSQTEVDKIRELGKEVVTGNAIFFRKAWTVKFERGDLVREVRDCREESAVIGRDGVEESQRGDVRTTSDNVDEIRFPDIVVRQDLLNNECER